MDQEFNWKRVQHFTNTLFCSFKMHDYLEKQVNGEFQDLCERIGVTEKLKVVAHYACQPNTAFIVDGKGKIHKVVFKEEN